MTGIPAFFEVYKAYSFETFWQQVITVGNVIKNLNHNLNALFYRMRKNRYETVEVLVCINCTSTAVTVIFA